MPRPGMELPLVGQPEVTERADAARNRRKVLAAARRLFTERGEANVSMDDIAAAAGVGKGTLYRRFGDKGGLAIALLDEQERRLQSEILSGRPPLGPGVGPTMRLQAFIRAYCAFLDVNADLVLISERNSVGARFGTGSYQFWRQHLVHLFEELKLEQPGLRAEVLLASLSAESYQRLAATYSSAELAAVLLVQARCR
ncbi:TetR/AcrR family transcriptional regulator [Kutzneria albida]|uniref:TetR/AcrR family transcriptional regulator n=1 Tax=Kutzneria albida TaxID=43357 RepID=UPI0004A9EE1B|nr:TetR/AcrR family transcriptional regulator [Kutzneria albida]